MKKNIRDTNFNQEMKDKLIMIAEKIRQEYPDSFTILFGSYARGEESADSDLDVCVLLPAFLEKRRDTIIKIRIIIRSIINMPIDVVVYTHEKFRAYADMSVTMQYNIEQEGFLLNGQCEKNT